VVVQIEFEPIRHIVLDQEGRLADGGLLGIGEGGDPPSPVGAEEMIGTSSARPPMPWSGTTLRRYSTPSERLTTSVSGTSDGDAHRRTQQRRDMHGLAGAIDAALGEHIGIEAVGASRPATPRSVSRRART
jgi:hypothetical protein